MGQLLSGHGCFSSYLKRIKKIDSSVCKYCRADQDTPQHTFCVCPRWDHVRSQLTLDLGTVVTPSNTVTVMLEGVDKWELVNNVIISIITQKGEDEERQQQLAEQLGVGQQAGPNWPRGMGKIQKTGRWVHDLNYRQMEKHKHR